MKSRFSVTMKKKIVEERWSGVSMKSLCAKYLSTRKQSGFE